jgi:hypothetical protein
MIERYVRGCMIAAVFCGYCVLTSGVGVFIFDKDTIAPFFVMSALGAGCCVLTALALMVFDD